MGGYLKKILRVDLSAGKITKETTDDRVLAQYIGGTGLAVRLLYEETIPRLDPYDARNPVIIATGPLTGTLVPGSGTYSVVARNALTGLTAASQANGFFGARLKYAGFDALVIQGRAERLVYLQIDDGRATIEDGAKLAGKGTFATELLLKKKYGEEGRDERVSVAAIGPAGENLVRFACVAGDRGHIAASGGIGAIWGSKNLKAIVVRGNHPIPVASAQTFGENAAKWRQEARDLAMGRLVNRYGTLGFFDDYHQKGWVPVKNLTTNIFPGAEKFSASYIRKKVHRGVVRACSGCTFHHCRTVLVTRGPYRGVVGEEPEYEMLAGFGPNWGIYDPGATTMLNKLNDDLGMDGKESSFLLSMLMEGYERGLMGKGDLDGIEPKWGDPETAAELLRLISRRQGLGGILAEGVMRAAERLGGKFPELAVYVKKGNAPHVHDSRTRWGTLFNQAISDMGSQAGQDLTGRGSPDLGIAEPTARPDAYLGEVTAKTVWWRQFQECLTYCYFQSATASTMIDTLNSLTGGQYDLAEALKVGRRVVNLLRMFNLREGMTKEHDSFSPRLGKPPVDGPARGRSLAPTFEMVRHAYYQASGWNGEGVPTRKLLKELDLGFTIKDFGAAGIWQNS